MNIQSRDYTQKMKVSILLAAYNGSEYIKEQIDSILHQTVADFELIICDDNSTDKTFEILKQYEIIDNRIRLYKNEHNLGFKRNFEKLLSLASCEYIALSDQDDIWTTNHLEQLLSNIGNNDLVCGNAYLADANCKPTGITLLECSHYDFLPETQDEWFLFLLHGSIFQGAACLFKKQLVNKILPIPEKIKFHDYWITMQAILNNGVVYLNSPILYYRQHGKNVTSNTKWTIKQRVKLAFSKNSNTRRYEQIVFLSILKAYIEENQKICKIENAIKYYQHDLPIIKLCTIPYFLRNYRLMYLSRNKKLFLLRFFKKYILNK